jgi:hypothetical protein
VAHRSQHVVHRAGVQLLQSFGQIHIVLQRIDAFNAMAAKVRKGKSRSE